MASYGQYNLVQMDVRDRFQTKLRVKRVNEQSVPEPPKTSSILTHSTMVFNVESITELEELATEYGNSLDEGNLAIHTDSDTEKVTMYVWQGPVLKWQQMSTGSGDGSTGTPANIDGGTF